MKQKFYQCSVCGQIAAKVKETALPLVCCGSKMQEIVPGTVEASREKHIPVYEVKGNIVKVFVGSVEHPMQKEHYIEWISLQTKCGNQRKALAPEIMKPYVEFAIVDGDEVEAVFAYCNLHGLWKA